MHLIPGYLSQITQLNVVSVRKGLFSAPAVSICGIACATYIMNASAQSLDLLAGTKNILFPIRKLKNFNIKSFRMKTKSLNTILVEEVFKRRIKYFSCEKYSEPRKASLTGVPKSITFLSRNLSLLYIIRKLIN